MIANQPKMTSAWDMELKVLVLAGMEPCQLTGGLGIGIGTFMLEMRAGRCFLQGLLVPLPARGDGFIALL